MTDDEFRRAVWAAVTDQAARLADVLGMAMTVPCDPPEYAVVSDALRHLDGQIQVLRSSLTLHAVRAALADANGPAAAITVRDGRPAV
jgi:hypothetical protein